MRKSSLLVSTEESWVLSPKKTRTMVVVKKLYNLSLLFLHFPAHDHIRRDANKLNTRVTLFFDVTNCPELSASQKSRILKKFHTRKDRISSF